MKGNASAINSRIIKVLRSYTDDNFVSVKQNKHIKVEGTYNGVLRSFHLSITPSKNYDANIRTCLQRFLKSIGVDRHIGKGFCVT